VQVTFQELSASGETNQRCIQLSDYRPEVTLDVPWLALLCVCVPPAQVGKNNTAEVVADTGQSRSVRERNHTAGPSIHWLVSYFLVSVGGTLREDLR